MPTKKILTLEAAELPDLPALRFGMRPEQAFDYAWASGLLTEVMEKVEGEFRSTGRIVHWQVFNERVLGPILYDVKPPPLAELCAKYEIGSETRASNMIVTVKRRFRSVLKRCLRRFVQSDAEVDKELNELFEILSSSAG